MPDLSLSIDVLEAMTESQKNEIMFMASAIQSGPHGRAIAMKRMMSYDREMMDIILLLIHYAAVKLSRDLEEFNESHGFDW